MKRFLQFMDLSKTDLMLIVLGNFTMAFAMINVHMQARITEGGVLGAALLLHRLFGVDPAIVSFVTDFSLYFLGVLLLSHGFLRRAVFSTVLYSTFLRMQESIGPVLPSLESAPLLAAILGGLLIGAGCGLVVSRGSATGGDDCLALIIEKHTHFSLSRAYFFSDATVLLLSFAVYLPLENLLYSFLTTLLSSYIIGQFELHLPQSSSASSSLSAANEGA